jgi:hypothetical protein
MGTSARSSEDSSASIITSRDQRLIPMPLSWVEASTVTCPENACDRLSAHPLKARKEVFLKQFLNVESERCFANADRPYIAITITLISFTIRKKSRTRYQYQAISYLIFTPSQTQQAEIKHHQ